MKSISIAQAASPTRWLQTETIERAIPMLAILALCFSLAGLALRGVRVDAYPLVNADEGYYGQLLHSRVVAAVSSPDAATGYDAFRFSGISSWPYDVAAWIGGTELVPARLASVFWGALLLLLTFGFTRELYGWLAAGAAAIVLSLAQAFVLTSSMVRPEIAAAAMGVAAAWLAWRATAERGRGWLLLPAGFLVVHVWQSHPANAGFAVLPPAAVLLRSPFRAWPAKLGWLAGGVTLAVVVYLVQYVLPDPATYFASVGYLRRIYFVPIRDETLVEVAYRSVDHLSRFNDEQQLGLLVFGIGVIVSLFRGPFPRSADWLLQIGLLGSFLWMAAFAHSKLAWYLMSYLPLCSMLLGRTISWPLAIRSVRGIPVPGAVVSALALLLAVFALEPFDTFGDVLRQRPNYTAISEDLRQVIPAGSDVAGNGTFYFASGQPSYKNLLFVQRLKFFQEHGIDFGEYLDFPPPTQYVVIDTNMHMDQEMRQTARPAIAERGGRVIGTFNRVGYGRVQVYALDRASVSTATAEPPP